MAHDKRPGFISGSVLAFLFVCLFTCLNLSQALGAAAAKTRQSAQAIRASVAFEEGLIRLDQGKAWVSFEEGPFHITLEEDEIGRRLILWDAGRRKEEVWLSGTASY